MSHNLQNISPVKKISFQDGFIVLESIAGIEMICSKEHFQSLYKLAESKESKNLKFEDKKCLGCQEDH